MHSCPNSNADQAVMLVKELGNPYDPNAIVVQTLSGQALGYVPKEHTTRFPHDTTFGHVYSMGRASSVGLWGATVSTSPCATAPHTLWRLSYSTVGHLSLLYLLLRFKIALFLSVHWLEPWAVHLYICSQTLLQCRWLCVQPCLLLR